LLNWSTSCTDWQRRVIAGETLITFPPLFPDEAEAPNDIYFNNN